VAINNTEVIPLGNVTYWSN